MPQFRFWNPYDAQWHYVSESELGNFPNAIIYEEDSEGNQTDLGTVASMGYFNNSPSLYDWQMYEGEPLDYRTTPLGERVNVNSNRAFWDQYRNPQGLSYDERISNLGLAMDENTGIYNAPVQLEPSLKVAVNPNAEVIDAPVQLEPSLKVAVNPNVEVIDAPVQLEPSSKIPVNPNIRVQEGVVPVQTSTGQIVGIPLSDYITLKSKAVNYDYLHPEMQKRLDAFARLVYQDTGGRPIFMTEGYRGIAGQRALGGRSNAATPGRSLHGFGIAADIRYFGTGGLQELANAAYQRDNSIFQRYGVRDAAGLVDAWAAQTGLIRNLHKAGKRNEEHHFQMIEDDVFRRSVDMARIQRERAKLLSGRNPGRVYFIAR